MFVIFELMFIFCAFGRGIIDRVKHKTPCLGCFMFGAGRGNRTPLSNLEGWSNSHYTIPA